MNVNQCLLSASFEFFYKYVAIAVNKGSNNIMAFYGFYI